MSLASQIGVVGGTPRRASAKCWSWLRPTRRSEFASTILAHVFTSRHISENSLQHVTGEARAPIALHDEWSQRCQVVEPTHLFSDDRMCAVLDAVGCGNPFLRQLTLSLSPRCIDVLTFSSDLSLSSVRHLSQRMRARRFEWRTVLAV